MSINRREYNKKYYLENKYKRKKEDPQKSTNRQLLNNYGITLEDKNTMVKEQHHKCLICKNKFISSRDTHVDHCHSTGKIRGILCRNCNAMLGGSRDDVEILANGIKYLNTRGGND